MRLGIPTVETAHDRNRSGIRRPDAEDGAGFAIVRDEMGSHLFVQAIVAALVKKVEILVGEKLGTRECQFRAHVLSRMYAL